jgi:hypothetical protein
MEEILSYKCSVCSCTFTEDEGGVDGHFGMLPVAFCPTCFSCMIDMAEQYLDVGDMEFEPEEDEELSEEAEEVFEALKGVRHVVINCQHGGFSLSHKGEIEYLTRAGIPYTLQERDSRDDTTRFGSVVVLSNGDTFHNRTIARDDPALVATVTALGERANGNFATLKVVKIPGDVEWIIEEYDGLEWVAEKHREWR